MAHDAGQREAERLIEQARNSGARALDLSGLGLEELPATLGQLTQLESLDISRNRMAVLPAAVERLVHLKELRLRGNPLTALPDGVTKLPGRVQILNEWAMHHYDRGERAEAIHFFERALAHDPDNEFALRWRMVMMRLSRQFPQARQAVEDALRRFPGNPAFLNELAWLHYDQQEYEPAIKIFDQTLRADPNNFDALRWRIRSLRLLARYPEAAAAVDDALRRLPRNVVLLMERAWLLYDRGQYAEAVQACGQVLEVEPAHKDALCWRISALRKWGRFEEALSAITEALLRLPGSAAILNERAWVYFDRKQYADAIRVFEEVLHTDPDNKDALRWRINSLRQSGQHAEAQQAISDALHRWPRDTALLTEQAWLHYDQKQYEPALKAFDTVLRENAGDLDALRFRISSLRMLRRFDEAQQAITDALRRHPNNPSILKEQAWLHYDKKDYDQALRIFEEVLKAEPADDGAKTWRISSLRMLRRYKDAKQAAAEALQTAPDNVAVLSELGALHYDQKDYLEAVKVFEKILKLQPGDEFATRLLAGALRKSRQFEKAGQFLCDALGRAKTPALLEEQGWLAYAQDKFEDALKSFDAAIEADPGLTSAVAAKADALRRLNRDREALDLLTRLRDRFPDDSETVETLGFFYLGRNDYSAAEKEFSALLARKPQDVIAINGLGSVRYDEARYGEAADYFQQALARSPDEPACHANLGWALVKQEPQPDLDQAEQRCRRALELLPGSASALGCLGLTAFKRGLLRLAEDYFRSSIEADSREGRHADLGALYVLMGRYEEAETALNEATKINKDDPQPRLELANLFLQTGKTNEAVRECRRVFALVPHSEPAARALAIALIRAEEYGEAEKILRDALRKQDEARRWRLHLTLAQMLTRLGDKTSEDSLYEEAAQEVQTAIRLKPGAPELHFQKGIINSKLKDPRGALKDFKECLRLDSTHFEAERYARLVRKQINDDIHRGSRAASWTVVAIAFALLAVLWFRYFVPAGTPSAPPKSPPVVTVAAISGNPGILRPTVAVPALITNTVTLAETNAVAPPASPPPAKDIEPGGKVSETMLTVMTPLLLGMIIVGFLLPALIRLKFAGVEAELTQPKEVISTGPKGETSLSSFGGSLSTIKP